jgi:hypothetical protein
VQAKGVKKVDLIVIRVNRAGELCMARPCKMCCRVLKLFSNLRHVYYSVDGGRIQREAAHEIHSEMLTAGYRLAFRRIREANCC